MAYNDNRFVGIPQKFYEQMVSFYYNQPSPPTTVTTTNVSSNNDPPGRSKEVDIANYVSIVI